DNRLRVEASGDEMKFFINDSYVATVKDSELSGGDILLISASPTTDLDFASTFDNFVLARYPN
ncbi:MAG: hypothetical protein KDI55_27345, partial [Anaerolineae bacterium]|nr:hypothetical protein [Anaerolineae bacterium]